MTDLASAAPEIVERTRIALHHLDLGFHLFPVWGTRTDGTCRCPSGPGCDQKPGKHPATQHGFKDATADPKMVMAFLASGNNYGIVWPGGSRVIFVLDIDGDDWRDRLRELSEQHGPLPVTKTTTTPSGGQHAFYEWPAEAGEPPSHDLFGFVTRWPAKGYVVGPGCRIGTTEYSDNGLDIAVLPLSWAETALPEQGAARNSTRPQDGQTVPPGQRHDYLRDRARALRGQGLMDDALYEAVRALYMVKCEPYKDERTATVEVHRAIGDVESKFGADAINADGGRYLVVTAASDIHVRPSKWLWKDRVPVGTVGLLGGREAVGKSTEALRIGADVTQGTLEGEYHGVPKGVVVVATEDSWEHIIVPKLMAAGADLSRVFRVEAVAAEGFDSTLMLPQDNERLREVIVAHDVALVILDPFISRLDQKLDTHKDAEVRRALEPLARLADESGVVILGLIHVSKSKDADPLTVLMASRAFVAVARFVLFMAVDPDDEERRLLGQPKNQYGRIDLATRVGHIEGVKVADTDEGPVFTAKMVWDGESSITIGDAVAEAREVHGATSEAAIWLEDYLSQGPAPRKEVMKAARAAEHGESAVKRAANRLKVASDLGGFPRQAVWSLSSNSRPAPGTRSDQTSEANGGESEPTEPTGPTDAVGSAGSAGSSPTDPDPTAPPRDAPGPGAAAPLGRRPACGCDPDLYSQHILGWQRMPGTTADWMCTTCDGQSPDAPVVRPTATAATLPANGWPSTRSSRSAS